MQVYIDHKILELNNNPVSTNQIMNEIQNHLDNNERYLSHIIVDGTLIYQDFQKHIEENIENIQKLDVITQTLNEYITEVFISTHDYTQKSIPLIHELSKDFSKSPNAITWSELINLLEGIVWMLQSVEKLKSILKQEHTLNRYGVWKKYVENVLQLEDVFSNFEVSITNKDNNNIAMLLSNKIIPLFEQINEQTKYLKNYMLICN